MIYCNIDGSITSNPGGRMGVGVVISDNNIEKLAEIHQEFDAAPDNSCNCAEYLALIECLNWLLVNGYPENKILIKSDSQLLIKQITGEWRIKEWSAGEKYNKKTKQKEQYLNKNGYYICACTAIQQLKYFTDIKFQWIPREQNTAADKLSKCDTFNNYQHYK